MTRLRVGIDCRYVRIGRHDGISRFTAGVVAHLPDRHDYTLLVHDERQLESLPSGLPWELLPAPTEAGEPLVARKVNRLALDAVRRGGTVIALGGGADGLAEEAAAAGVELATTHVHTQREWLLAVTDLARLADRGLAFAVHVGGDHPHVAEEARAAGGPELAHAVGRAEHRDAGGGFGQAVALEDHQASVEPGVEQ